MLQQTQPKDYVIATGETNTLEDFVVEVFTQLGLDWQGHVTTDPSLIRPSEIMISRGKPLKAEKELGWKAQYRMRDVIRMMLEAEQS